MIAGRPSYTAMSVAAHRALHQIIDRPPIFHDPLAGKLMTPADFPQWDKRLKHAQDRFARALRTFLAVRSQFAEDRLAAAVARGTQQYVVLGAGLDTFAYRNKHDTEGLRVFEVDYPATQAWKRKKLESAGIPIPSSLTYVPLDFEHQTLPQAFSDAGLRTDQPTFFSWLGVTVYLTRPSIEATLRSVATCAPGSEIVFDYGVDPRVFRWRIRFVLFLLRRRVARIGEPWKTFYRPSELAADLRRLGFKHVDDFGAKELMARYCANRTDGLRLGPTARIAAAGL